MLDTQVPVIALIVRLATEKRWQQGRDVLGAARLQNLLTISPTDRAIEGIVVECGIEHVLGSYQTPLVRVVQASVQILYNLAERAHFVTPAVTLPEVGRIRYGEDAAKVLAN